MGFFKRIASHVGGALKRIGSASNHVVSRIGDVASTIATKARNFDDWADGIPGDFVRSIPGGSLGLKVAGGVEKGLQHATRITKGIADAGTAIQHYGDTGQIPHNIMRHF